MKRIAISYVGLFLLLTFCSKHTIEPPTDPLANESGNTNDGSNNNADDSNNNDNNNDNNTDALTDFDGNVYTTVTIGNQVWMVENLKTTHYQNGDAITSSDQSTWPNLTTGAYRTDSSNNTDIYGYLYNWHAINDSRSIAPDGWHVPTDADWKELEMYLGLSQSSADMANCRGSSIGGSLKETGTTLWSSPNTDATNATDFSARPAGRCNFSTGAIQDQGEFAYFWTATQDNSTSAWSRSLSSTTSYICRYSSNKKQGYSVRLVKD